ncbi:MAG: SDR family oxidoreductase [Candidatus Paceibacterota bacterium]|jgi:3-oxoacyl-[acyl-carrier protein] reductase
MTRTALIGGASKGLGFGCAQALAQKGCRIVMCARNELDLNAAAHTLHSQYSNVDIITIPCDWSKKEALEQLQMTLQSKKIDIDILINNVGGPTPGTISQQNEKSWEEALDLLFRSTIRVYSIVLPGMRKRRWGRIVNILSTTALEPSPLLATSSVVRAALASYAKLMAWDVVKDGITINSLMPAGFLTARTNQLIDDAARRRSVDRGVIVAEKEAELPSGHFMDPIELGYVAAFLASDEAAGITGTLLPVDGGAKKSL